MGKIVIKFSISYPLLTQRISRWMTFYTQVIPEQLWSTFSIRFASHTSITDSNYEEEMKKKWMQLSLNQLASMLLMLLPTLKA